MKNSIKYIMTLTAVMTAGPLFAQDPAATGNPRTTDNTPVTNERTERSEKPGMSDKHFIREAAAGNYAEVALGQLAMQKSQNQQVKDFAQQLIQDHTQANQQLQTLAQSQSVDFPKEADKKQQHHMKQLEKLNGAEFDKEFATHMIRDHAKDVSEYNKISQKSNDQALKQYADTVLPKLQKHLETARSVGTAVGLSADQISSLEKKYNHGMGAPGSGSDTQRGSYWKRDKDNKDYMDNLNKDRQHDNLHK